MSKYFKFDSKKGVITVILLSYNTGEMLYDAIDSVLMQDYPFIELIVADDGSEIFPRERIEKYIQERKRNNIIDCTIIHRKRNVGTVKNINRALKISKGEYIRILGGDDAYPYPNTFSDTINMMKDNVIAVVGKWMQCDEHLNPIKDKRTEKSNDAINKVLDLGYVEGRKFISKHDIFPIANQATCYKRLFFEK